MTEPKPRGRPPLPPSEVRKKRPIRLTDAMWERVQAVAEADGVSASAYCEQALDSVVASDEYHHGMRHR